jgi:predicted nucleic acid-binding protein
MKKKILLDSYALLAYLKKEGKFLNVKDILSSSDKVILMNELNVGETYYIIARQRGYEQADYFLEVVLPGLPIKTIHNSFEQVIEASRLKAKYSISFIDCFVITTALAEKATILTGDPEFKKAGKIVKIEWMN